MVGLTEDSLPFLCFGKELGFGSALPVFGVGCGWVGG